MKNISIIVLVMLAVTLIIKCEQQERVLEDRQYIIEQYQTFEQERNRL